LDKSSHPYWQSNHDSSVGQPSVCRQSSRLCLKAYNLGSQSDMLMKARLSIAGRFALQPCAMHKPSSCKKEPRGWNISRNALSSLNNVEIKIDMRPKQESDGLHTTGEHASGSGKPGYRRIMSLNSPLKLTVVFTINRHWKHH
jgi:hypothetical protein